MTKFSTHRNTVFTAKSARSTLLASAAIMAISGLSAPALAQENVDDEEARAGEILVIARKQSESLQEVPVTVTVIGADTLDKYQVNEVADVVSRVPSLNVQVGGSGSGGQISLRGVGSSNISAAFDSAVAFDYDGVQISTMRLVQTGFFDVGQIDILKGPQSLFFGKSASGGVFAVRSADPTPEWEVGGKASYEFEEEGYTVEGYVSGPLSDTLGIRIAGQYQDISRYVELEAGTPSVFIDSGKALRNTIIRGTLQWDPVDNFSANLKVNFNHNYSDSLLGHSDINCGANGVADDISLFSGAITFESNATCDTDDGLYPTGDGIEAIRVIPEGTTGADRYDGTSYNETDIFFARLNMDLDLTDTLTLSSTTGYLTLDNEYIDHFGYVGITDDGLPAGLAAPFANGLDQFSQEVRLTSDFGGMFNFMVGAFYEYRDIPLSTSQNALNFSLLFPDPVTGYQFDWYSERNTTAEAVSLFASTIIDLTDKLELSGGLRWTSENKSATVSFPYVHAGVSGTGVFLPSGFFAGPIKYSDTNISPEVTLKYQASDDINVFASFKTGYKSGGIDNSALPSSSLADLASTDAEVKAAAEAGLIYDAETSKGGEIGIKTQFANRTVTLNATAYYYIYDDLQVQNFDGRLVQFSTTNASELTTKGVDIEWLWATPLEGLNFSGSVGYLDAKYTDTFITGTGADGIAGNEDDPDIDGREAARAPKWSGNVAFDWAIPVGDSLEFGLNGNAAFSDSYFAAQTRFDNFRQESYVSFDASASIGAQDDAWRLSLIAINLTDKLWVNTAGDRPFLPAGGDDFVVTQNRGRQVFVEAAFKF